MQAALTPSSSLPENDGDAVLRLKSAGAEMNVLAPTFGVTTLPGTATVPCRGGKTSSNPLPGAATNRTLAPPAGPAAIADEAAAGPPIIAPAHDYQKDAVNAYCCSLSAGRLTLSLSCRKQPCRNAAKYERGRICTVSTSGCSVAYAALREKTWLFL